MLAHTHTHTSVLLLGNALRLVSRVSRVCLGAAVGLCGGETHLDLIVGVMLG